MGATGLLVSDFVISFMWVWSGTLIKVFVYEVLGLGHGLWGETVKCALYIVDMFFFAFLGKLTKGGSYNPLTVLASGFSGDFGRFLFTVGARIPAQAVGSITGVRLIIATFPHLWLGPRLSIDVHRGALTEGLLAFVIVIISLGLGRKIPGSFYTKTWISSVSKLTLQVLGSDLTGGFMNPASAMGWAYARGDHITKEHVLVYWLAPVEATLLAVWIFRLLVGPLKSRKQRRKNQSEEWHSSSVRCLLDYLIPRNWIQGAYLDRRHKMCFKFNPLSGQAICMVCWVYLTLVLDTTLCICFIRRQMAINYVNRVGLKFTG